MYPRPRRSSALMFPLAASTTLKTTATVVSNASLTSGVVAPQELVALIGPGIGPGRTSQTSVQITDSAGNTEAAQFLSVSAGQSVILTNSGGPRGRIGGGRGAEWLDGSA